VTLLSSSELDSLISRSVSIFSMFLIYIIVPLRACSRENEEKERGGGEMREN
jgi:hypothetical protein